MIILGQAKPLETREFYILSAIRERWSSRELERQIKSGAVLRSTARKTSGALEKAHPSAIAEFKNAYSFEFLSLQDGHSEADLHRALLHNLGRFITELGRDFCFVGTEYPVQVGTQDFAIDLLFFHRGLASGLHYSPRDAPRLERDMKKTDGRKTQFRGVKALGGGKYRLRIYVTDPRTKREVEKVMTVSAASAKEAYRLKEIEELKTREKKQEQVHAQGSVPLGQLAQSWLDEIKKRTHEEDPTQLHLAPATRDRYTQAVNDYIKPAEDIKEWRKDMLEAGYRRSTVNGAHRVLKVILRSVGNQAASAVKALNEKPDAQITRREPNLLTAPELDRFLNVAKARDEHYALILVLITSTMRISTALALRWEDLDLETSEFLVSRRLSGSGVTAEVVPGVKRSRFSEDYPPLLPEVHDALLELKATYNDAQKASGLLFPSHHGKHRARSLLYKPFISICEEAQITKRFTPHGCRRTGAKLYGKTSGTRMAMSIAGHTTEAMHAHYAPVDAAEKQAAARAVFGKLQVIEGGARIELGAPKTRASRLVLSSGNLRAGKGTRTLDFNLGKGKEPLGITDKLGCLSIGYMCRSVAV